jgi:predicted transcriptional regulator
MEQIIMNFDTKFNETLTQQEELLPKAKYPLSLGLDHPSVKKVIQIALDITKENRLITTELLYNIAKKELKIPRCGLKKIIQMLLNRKILVDGSKITKITILKNKTRKYIYWLIKTYIGAHYSFLKELISIQQKSEIGVGQLIWHLEMLLKFNLIKKVKVKNSIIFLPIEIDNNMGILHFLLRDEINRNIVDLILEEETIDRTDIYKQLELKRENLYYHIKKLVEFNIILPLVEDENCITINPNKKNLINQVINNISNSN